MRVTKRQLDLIMVMYFLVLGWIIYSMVMDPDPDQRQLSRLNFRYRMLQRTAERLGRWGLDAEKDYLKRVEEMRTI